MALKSAAKIKDSLGAVRGFRHFISDYGIMPLAVGVVIGSAVNDLVKAIVADLITPFISLVSPDGKLQNFEFTIDGAVFKVGHALNSLVSFLVIAWVVYITAKVILRNDDLLKKK